MTSLSKIIISNKNNSKIKCLTFFNYSYLNEVLPNKIVIGDVIITGSSLLIKEMDDLNIMIEGYIDEVKLKCEK